MSSDDTSGTGMDSVAQSSNETYMRPTTRQRVYKAPPSLEVPHIEQDAAERKRVLNVLAQRRYRERRRLNRNGKGKCRVQGKGQEEMASNVAHVNVALASAHLEEDGQPNVGGSTSVVAAATQGDDDDVLTSTVPGQDLRTLGLDLGQQWPETAGADLNLDLDLDPDPDQQPSLSPLANSWMSSTPLSFPLQASGSDNNANANANAFVSYAAGTTATAAGTDALDPSYLSSLEPSPDVPSYFSSNPDSSSTHSSPPSSQVPPDSYLLAVNELVLLRAMTSIAARLGCSTTLMWDVTANSPFNTGIGTPPDLLPPTWRPTTLQVVAPHHPVLDFLPWPGVRDRLIGIMGLPEDLRPAGPVRDPMALAYFAYDMEDAAEGVRIWGGDPYDAGAWEVGQVFFKNWWFVLDRAVVEQSNRLRRERGAPVLRLGGGPDGPDGPKVQDVSC